MRERRGDRFVRRPRTSSAEPTDNGPASADQLARPSYPLAAPTGRRRRHNFAAQLGSARDLIGLDSKGDDLVSSSALLISPHLDHFADHLDAELRSRPETAAIFVEVEGSITRRDALRRWLTCVVEQPLDSVTADYVAAIAHNHIRPMDPSNRVKARYMVNLISQVRTLIIETLTVAILERVELSECVEAWCKLLTIHLDMLLSVYAATEGSPHWY